MRTHREPLSSVLETIGETPLVEVAAAPDAVPVYAKLESFNPGASVKDRIGLYMCRGLLQRGDIEPGGTIIEPTAGNTGIGMALAAGQLDMEAVFVVPERFSVEKQDLMAALGAEIVNTPTEEGMGGAIDRAHELADERDDAVVPQQFANELNVEAHYETTGPEIHGALDGEVGAVVMGCGTAGTLMGTARYLLERRADTRVVAVEPEGSVFRQALGDEPEGGEYRTEGIGTHDADRNELFDPPSSTNSSGFPTRPPTPRYSGWPARRATSSPRARAPQASPPETSPRRSPRVTSTSRTTRSSRCFPTPASGTYRRTSTAPSRSGTHDGWRGRERRTRRD